MNVNLTPELETIIRQKVASGLYNNASEVVREALRLMTERDRLQRLRSALTVGQEQLERGEGRLYTPELRAEIRDAARRKVKAGKTPSDDVIPSSP